METALARSMRREFVTSVKNVTSRQEEGDERSQKNFFKLIT
jgi:hypothetical protein